MIYSNRKTGAYKSSKYGRFLKMTAYSLCLAMVFSIAGCAADTAESSVSTDADGSAITDTNAAGTAVNSGGAAENSQSGDAGTDTTDAAALESDYFSVKELALYEGGEGDTVYVKSVTPIGENIAVLVQITPVSSQETLTGGKNEVPPGETGVKSIFLIYDITGSQISQIDLGAKMDVQSTVLCSAVNESGNPVCVAQTGDPNSGIVERWLYTFDGDGNLAADPVPLEDMTSSFYPQGMVIDPSGNIYVSSFGRILVLNSQGETVCDITDNTLNGKLFFVGDTIYADGYKYDPSGGVGAYVLYPVDTASGNLGDPIAGYEQYEHSLYSCRGKIYTSDSSGLFTIDPATKEKNAVLMWKDTDLLIGNSTNEFYVLSEDTIFCLSKTINSEQVPSLSLLTRETENPNKNKQILTLACISAAGDADLQKAVITFNRQSAGYRIEINDYAADFDYSTIENENDMDAAYDKMIDQINLDILSGSGPDILYGNSWMPLSNYESKGLLVDLNTLIEKDSSFNKADYIESVINMCETDGHLYKMPGGFYIDGLMGRQSVIGDRSGWTADEFKMMADNLPDGMSPVSKYTTQSLLLSEALNYSMDSYVNETTGEVSFAVDEFYQLLDYAKVYGAKDAAETEFVALPEDLFKDGQVALMDCDIFAPSIYSDFQNFAGEPISIVGYPSAGKSGPICRMSNIVAISSESSQVDGCWEFVKVCLSEEVQHEIADWYNTSGGIPVLKTEFEAQLEESMNPDLAAASYDWFGNPAKAITAEQAQEYRDLIDNLSYPVDSDNEILSIILEEVPAYFSDQKSAEEVASLIQDRVQTLVYER